MLLGRSFTATLESQDQEFSQTLSALYHVLVTALIALDVLTHLTLIVSLLDKCYCCPHFTDEDS